MPHPTISVVMPVFNAARYVGEAIESVRAQTFGDYEFLVFDDGSRDRSLAVIRRHARRDPRIKVYACRHRGYTHWLNEGLGDARGELYARMDADDVCRPERFARQLEYLAAHPQCVALGSDVLVIDPDGAPLGVDAHATDHETLDAAMLAGGLGVISHPTVMVRTQTLREIGGYREAMEPLEDFDLWFRLAEKGRLANLSEVLLHYRHHHKNVIFTEVDRQRRVADQIVNQARARRGLPPLAQSIWTFEAPSRAERHRRWAIHALESNHHRTALKHALAAVRHDPTLPGVWDALWNIAPRTLQAARKRARQLMLRG